MTQTEYETKIQMAKVSDAPVEVKEKYIEELEAKYKKKQKLLSEIDESKADIKDIVSNW